jgi:flagellar hook-basal body complex protein FliE
MEGIGRTGPAGVAGLYRAVEKKSGESSEGSFGDLIKQAVSDVNHAQKEADSAIQKLATGNSQDIHQTMIAMEKADVSFKMLMQVRDKVVAAYQEIMRMQA